MRGCCTSGRRLEPALELLLGSAEGDRAIAAHPIEAVASQSGNELGHGLAEYPLPRQARHPLEGRVGVEIDLVSDGSPGLCHEHDLPFDSSPFEHLDPDPGVEQR